MAWKGYLAPLITRVVGGGSTPRYSDPDPTGSAHLLAQRDSDPTGSAHLLKQEIAEPTGSAHLLLQANSDPTGSAHLLLQESVDVEGAAWLFFIITLTEPTSPTVWLSTDETRTVSWTIPQAKSTGDFQLYAIHSTSHVWWHLGSTNAVPGQTNYTKTDCNLIPSGSYSWIDISYRPDTGVWGDWEAVKVTDVTLEVAHVSTGSAALLDTYSSDPEGSAHLLAQLVGDIDGAAHLLSQMSDDSEGAAHLLAALTDDVEGAAHLQLTSSSDKTGAAHLLSQNTSDKTGSAHLLASLSSDKEGSAHLLEAGSTPRTSDPDPTGSAHLLAQCTSDKDGAAHLLSNNVDDIDGAAYANWMWADYPADEEVVTGTQCNMVAKFGASLPAGQVGYWVENVATYTWYAVGYEYHAAGETEVTLNDELYTIGGYLTVDGGSGSAPLPVGRYRLRWYWRPYTEVWVWPLNIFDYSYGDTYFTLISPDSDYDGSATLAATQDEDVNGSAALVAQLDEDVTGSAHLAGTEDSDVTGSAALLDSYESDVSGSAHLMLQESDDVTGAAWLMFLMTITDPPDGDVWYNTDGTATISWTIPVAKSTGDFSIYAIDTLSGTWQWCGSTLAVAEQTNYTKTDCVIPPSGRYTITIWYRPDTGYWGNWGGYGYSVWGALYVRYLFTGSAALLGSYEADATGAAALKSERTLDRDGAAFLIRKPYTSVTGAAVLVRRKNKVTRALQRFVINTTKESGIMKQDIVPTTIDKLNVKQGGVASVSKDD